jgi:hypothetical protein
VEPLPHGESLIKLGKMLESCVLCPRKCKVDRTRGEQGFCRLGTDIVMDCAIAHHGDAQNPLTSKNSPPILRPVESTMPYQCNGRHKPEDAFVHPIFLS